MLKTIREIHGAYLAKKTSPVEVTQEYLNAIRKSDHNAFLHVCEERAMSQARRAAEILDREKAIPAGQPLLGIPMGIKDALTIDGVVTTAASKMLEGYVPPYTCTAVKKLESAGVISLGKLNMDEFAMGGSNENSAYGNVKHPTHHDRVPGGSSGGSGAAVRAGLCAAALGTDTGGSIRLPASYCGVAGVKPTYGRVSRYGLIAFASSLDSIGPMTNSVEDSARILQVMSGHDPLDSTSAPVQVPSWTRELDEKTDWSKIRVGVPKEYFVEGITDHVNKSVRGALKFFESKGAKLVEISLPHTEYAIATYYMVAVSEASSNLARYDGVRFGMRPKEALEATDLQSFYEICRSRFGAEVKRRIILGTFALSSGYYDAYFKRATLVRRRIQDDFKKAFEKVDVIAGPVAPDTAFKVGEKSKNPLALYLVDIFTAPGSLAGVPSLSVPCGEDSQGLSIGLQLIGPHFGEGKIMKLAHELELALRKGELHK